MQRPPQGHPKATQRSTKCQLKATQRPPKCHSKATQRPLKGHQKAIQRPSRGHPRAPKGHKKEGWKKATISFFQSSFNNSYHDDICAIILQYRYYQIHKYNRFLVRMICLSHLFISLSIIFKVKLG